MSKRFSEFCLYEEKDVFIQKFSSPEDVLFIEDVFFEICKYLEDSCRFALFSTKKCEFDRLLFTSKFYKQRLIMKKPYYNLFSCIKNVRFPILPPNVEKVELDVFIGHISNVVWPKSLKYLKVEDYDKPTLNHLNIHIPNTLHELVFGDSFNRSVNFELPDGIKKIKFGFYFNNSIISKLPDSLEKLKFGHLYDQIVKFEFPERLRVLEFGKRFNNAIISELPDTLEELKFGLWYNRPFNKRLPRSLKILKFHSSYNQEINVMIPKNCKVERYGWRVGI